MKRALIVDDDPANAEIARFALQKAGYEVVHAANGRSAQARLKSTCFDLVILDLMLPDTDGFALLKTIRADPTTRSLPLFILTTLSEKSVREKAKDLGATGFLAKPFESRSLLEAVSPGSQADRF